MSVAEKIERKIREAFHPLRLEVIDDSAKHAGHAGARPEGETHFRLEIVATAFEGVGRVERQRMVNRVLAEELAGPVHALAMQVLAPDDEVRKRR